jgi:hypothetical protein
MRKTRLQFALPISHVQSHQHHHHYHPNPMPGPFGLSRHKLSGPTDEIDFFQCNNAIPPFRLCLRADQEGGVLQQYVIRQVYPSRRRSSHSRGRKRRRSSKPRDDRLRDKVIPYYVGGQTRLYCGIDCEGAELPLSSPTPGLIGRKKERSTLGKCLSYRPKLALLYLSFAVHEPPHGAVLYSLTRC